MRQHLEPQDLIDVLDETADVRVRGHVEACDGCRLRVEELQNSLGLARQVEVPEPSPLFWEHFSTRVHDRIAEARIEPSWSWLAPGRLFASASRAWRVPLVAGAAAALLVAGLVMVRRAPAPRAALSAEIGPDSGTALDAAVPTADDPSLALMADLAETIGWDDAAAAGLTTEDVVVDRAMTDLTSGERQELGRLLREALAQPGA